MKKLLFALMLAISGSITMHAQNAAYQQSVAKYKTAKTATANVEMIQQSKAMKKGKTATGFLYMMAPDKVAISVNNGKDQLVMNGNTFTMVIKGKKHVASAKTASQFAAFKAVFQSVLSGGKTDISKIQGVSLAQNGGNVVITMTPAAEKRMMFTSFVLTINKTSNRLVSLSMNSKRGSTEYKFSSFNFGSAVNSKVFIP